MKQVSAIWAVAYEVRGALVAWLIEHEGKRYYARLSKKDLLRLTRLKVWAFRHHVDYDEMFTLILPHIRRTLGTNETDTKRFGLGVSLATLTGNTAERILIEALRQKYPEREWISVWRSAEIDRQLERETVEEMGGLQTKYRGWKETDTVESFIAAYRKKIFAERSKMQLALSDPKRRMPYRNNPWI